MTFKRMSSRIGNTGAFRIFSAHHTEINNMYWTFVPTWSHNNYLARKNINKSPQLVFVASGPDVHRLDPTMPKFIDNYKMLANWVRLSALVSALSYFEVYLKKIITLSLLSDPAVRLGKSKVIEGTYWLKMGIKDDIETLVVSCVKGDWNTRTKGIRTLFGFVPSVMANNLSSLEEMRIIRNKHGHTFGRSLKCDYSETSTEPMVSLSDGRLRKYLKIIFEIAKDADEYFLTKHIGCFEELLYFHNLKKGDQWIGGADEAVPLHKNINGMKFFGNVSKQYCRALVKFYNGC